MGLRPAAATSLSENHPPHQVGLVLLRNNMGMPSTAISEGAATPDTVLPG